MKPLPEQIITNIKKKEIKKANQTAAQIVVSKPGAIFVGPILADKIPCN